MCASSSTTRTLEVTAAPIASIDHHPVSRPSPMHDENVNAPLPAWRGGQIDQGTSPLGGEDGHALAWPGGGATKATTARSRPRALPALRGADISGHLPAWRGGRPRFSVARRGPPPVAT